jgi:hypothetical protein
VKKAPIMKSTYGPSLKALHSTQGPVLLGLSRGFRRRIAIVQITMATKAETLTAQPNPTLGMRYWIVAGNITLPMPVPVAAIAIASALFLLKYELITVSGGMNMMPSPSPVQTPCARKICQYCVATLVMNVPKMTMNEPAASVVLTYPASARRPDTVHARKVRNSCTEPIHEICACGSCSQSL